MFLRASKVVSALPGTLDANTIYFVRTGLGFDIYVTNSGGTIQAYKFSFSLPNTTNANKNTQEDGVIYKNGVRFLHDFNYGNNGTVTTVGRNLHLGLEAGNFTSGLAATSTTHASNNVGIGFQTHFNLTTGQENVGIGNNNQRNLTTGAFNCSSGHNSLQNLTTGSQNNAIGYAAGAGLTTGSGNNAMGSLALLSCVTGLDNNAMGGLALNANTGSYNCGVGSRALQRNSTGQFNTGIGWSVASEITTGSNNVFIGANTGIGITTGSNNTVIGSNVTGLSAALNNTVIIADGAGNQRIRIDSNGQAGVNEQTPTAQLQVTVGSASRVGQIAKLAASATADADQILDSANNELRSTTAKGKAQVNGTITPAGTTGAQTINKPSGAVNFAAGATSLVVTCDQCTTTSFVSAYVATNDSTMKSIVVVPGNGSFVLYPDAAPTAETRVFFEIVDIV